MGGLITQYRGLKRELYIIFIGRLVTAMGSFVWPMLTFFLTTSLGYSDGTAALMIACSTLVSLPMSLIAGKLSDRYSRKTIIIVFDLISISLYFLSAALPIGLHTAIMLFVAGLFQNAETPAYDALNADFSIPAQRDKAFSLTYLGYNVGFVVGAFCAGILFEYHTRLAFLLNGVAVGTSTLLIALFVHMENRVRAEENIKEHYGVYEQPADEKLGVLKVLKDRKVVILVLFLACFASLPNVIAGILLPLQLKELIGAHGAAVYGRLYSLNGVTVILAMPVVTMTLRRVTDIPKAALGVTFFSIGMIFFAAPKAQWILFPGMFIFTLGEVCSVLGTNPYYSRRVPASHRGRVGGVSSVVNSLFSALVQFLVSLALTLSGSNYLLIWLLFLGVCVIAALLYLLAYRLDRKRFPVLYKK